MSRLLAIAVVMCLASGAFAQTGTLDDPVILVEGYADLFDVPNGEARYYSLSVANERINPMGETRVAIQTSRVTGFFEGEVFVRLPSGNWGELDTGDGDRYDDVIDVMMGDSDRLFRVNASCNVGGADVCDEVTIEFAYFVVYINGADSFFPPFPLMDNAETAPMLVDGVGKQRCVNATAAAGEEFGLVKFRSRLDNADDALTDRDAIVVLATPAGGEAITFDLESKYTGGFPFVIDDAGSYEVCARLDHDGEEDGLYIRFSTGDAVAEYTSTKTILKVVMVIIVAHLVVIGACVVYFCYFKHRGHPVEPPKLGHGVQH